MYNYFVSYAAPHSGGFGNAKIAMNRRVTSYDDLKDIGNILKQELGFGVVILFYQLIEEWD